MTGHIRIGEAASRAGVNIQTLRYYERRGLLPKPARAGTSNYRLYTDDDVRLVRFVKDAQSLGFTLNEIKELFALRADSSDPCVDVRQQAVDKMAEIETKIHNLHRMRELLEKLVAACPTNGLDDCPTLQAMDPQEEHDEP